MELLELLDALRASYLAQLEAVYEQQVPLHDAVFPEIGIEFSGNTYRKLFVVDFVGQSDGENNAIELVPTKEAYHGPLMTEYRDVPLDVGSVEWSAIKIAYTPRDLALTGFDTWFDTWMVLDGTAQSGESIFFNTIHSARVEAGAVEVDFGSAETAALLALMDVLIDSGAESLVASTNRVP